MNRRPAAGVSALAFIVLVAMNCVQPVPAQASGEREKLLVSTSWLAGHIQDPDLVLLHVGDPAEYDQAHLPGAQLISLHDLSQPMAMRRPPGETPPGPAPAPDGLVLEMLPAEELRQHLESFGISDTSRVVVYFGNDWVSPSTRVIFTLDYAGLGEHAVLLDGGQPAWVRDGHAVTAEVPAKRTGKLAPLHLRPSVVDAGFVLAHREAPGYVVIDARDGSFYDGIDQGGSPEHPQRAGHIAGARSLPFSSTTSDDLHLLPPAELQKLFDRAGAKKGDVIVGYCHIGQQATAMLFAARTLGYDVRLYDGSFQDWSRHADYPVEVSPRGSPTAPAEPAKP
ncbi:MAG: rhodanese-like domain-containing protein [Thermoanaerobaculia bacterium]